MANVGPHWTPQSDLATHGQFVSAALIADGALSVRLTPESVLQPHAAVYVLQVFEPVNGEGTLRAVELVREAGEYVYVVVGEEAVALVGEGGEEVCIHAMRVAVERPEPNAKEFREALAFSGKLYENSHEAGRKTEHKLQRVRELLLSKRAASQSRLRGTSQPHRLAYFMHSIERMPLLAPVRPRKCR